MAEKKPIEKLPLDPAHVAGLLLDDLRKILAGRDWASAFIADFGPVLRELEAKADLEQIADLAAEFLIHRHAPYPTDEVCRRAFLGAVADYLDRK